MRIDKPVIMLIDDETLNNIIHKRILIKHFPTAVIQIYNNPNDALTHLIEHQEPFPDLVLLDIHMPEMDAWEFLEALPSAGNWPSTYICSASEDEKNIQKAKKYPAVKGFLYKPIDVTVVEQLLNS